MVGQVIGHYLIDANIGEGRSAVVYKARDIRLNRTVAIKVLKDEHLQHSLAWGRLLREAQIASALNHPNVCALYDIGEEQDVHYVVLEFVEGKTLRATLELGPLPTQIVFQYGIQLAEAMAYTHGAGILHRDFKSSNIIVTRAGQIKVVDFGLATLMEEAAAKQNEDSHSSAQDIAWFVGTLPYMAPELLHGKAATIQSSVWSLGVILFEMLTGQLPFVGRTSFELGAEIMKGKIRPLPADVPGGLRAIVQRCLVRDVASRYYSAVEVVRYLQSEFVSFQVRCLLSRPDYLKRRALLQGQLKYALTVLSAIFHGN